MNTPKLRFPGFSGEWKAKKVHDVFQVTRGQVLAVPKTRQVADGNFIYPVYSSQTKKKGLMGYYSDYLFENAITWTTDGANAGEVNYRIGKFYCTNVCGVLLSDSGYANETTATALNKVTRQYVSYVGNPKLMNDVMASIKILLPSVDEQEMIAGFLTVVDERIAAMDKKIELLQQYKKGVMQKLFTQKLRFKDENGKSYPDWQEKRLGDFLTERNEQAPKSDDYPLMAFVAYEGVAPKGDRYNREFLVSDGKGKKYKRTEYGDFIYSSNNLETGSIGLNRYGSASISPVYSIFQADKSCSYEFIGSFLLRRRLIYEMTRYRQGVIYGQWRIHESDFLKIKENIPALEEQQKIADFLISLDDKINLEKTKLDQAKLFKKSLLQRMFV